MSTPVTRSENIRNAIVHQRWRGERTPRTIRLLRRRTAQAQFGFRGLKRFGRRWGAALDSLASLAAPRAEHIRTLLSSKFGAMPMSCVAYGCTSRDHPSSTVRFFRFPSVKRDRQRRESWIRAVKRQDAQGRPWQPSAASRLCRKHFVTGFLILHPKAAHHRKEQVTVNPGTPTFWVSVNFTSFCGTKIARVPCERGQA
ncbi:hypothetical protein HPB49_006308 [Dermacentor silvarum]|uniref:Uncharacterized protein n=1 Tax=Dermacentor silvarum TaxID=543639 RepID=A0ACB8CVQ9_DERSI|nr:hypothetical protein HPB49_006308 [Dermacentor silvarum]